MISLSATSTFAASEASFSDACQSYMKTAVKGADANMEKKIKKMCDCSAREVLKKISDQPLLDDYEKQLKGSKDKLARSADFKKVSEALMSVRPACEAEAAK